MNPTISITIVCAPEQLELVHERVAALQQALYDMGVAFSIKTTRPPRNPPIDLAEALRDPGAFVRGFEEVERGIVHRPESEP
jgi:hypothetical protein